MREAAPGPSQGRRTLSSPADRAALSQPYRRPGLSWPRLRSPREDGPRLRCRRSRAGPGPCRVGSGRAAARPSHVRPAAPPGCNGAGRAAQVGAAAGERERGGQCWAGGGAAVSVPGCGGARPGAAPEAVPVCSPCSPGTRPLLLRPRPPCWGSFGLFCRWRARDQQPRAGRVGSARRPSPAGSTGSWCQVGVGGQCKANTVMFLKDIIFGHHFPLQTVSYLRHVL